jgi:hypothetical protein
MTKTCEKLRCVANLDGQCAVETCKGELRSTGRKCKSAEDAATEYQIKDFIEWIIEKRRKEDSDE